MYGMDGSFDPGTVVSSGFGDIMTHIPTVATAAIGVAIAFWGVRKLAGFFKSLAK